MTFEVGDIVAATGDLITDCEWYGPSLCAKRGEQLVVHKILSPASYELHKASIKNPSPQDLFWARDRELDLVRGINEDFSNLAYSATFQMNFQRNGVFDSWEDVAKVLRLFKQKKHKGFYLEVEELSHKRGYRVRVFKQKNEV